MRTDSKLPFLLPALGIAVIVAVAQNRTPSPIRSGPGAAARRYVPTHPVPAVKTLVETPAGNAASRPWHRNPFKYADEPAVPEAPPPPPPPPPDPKPESRLIGIVYQGELLALFSYKNDVIPLREGGVLEEKYLVREIEPESVLLEDQTYHNTAVFSLGKK